MRVGWWHLDDSGEPIDAAGCLDIAGSVVAQRAPVGLLRVYEHKHRPDPLIFGQSVKAWASQLPPGWVMQAANEANLEHEQFGGGPEDYAAWCRRVREATGPAVQLGLGGFSPGYREGARTYADVDGWRALQPLFWEDRAAIAVLHVYGRSIDELVGSFDRQAALLPAATPIVIGETNFGPAPGFSIDKDAWARDALRPFLDHLAASRRVLFALYFARTWPHPDAWLAGGTTVDGAGTAIETVLREWRAPQVAPATPVVASGITPPGRPEPAPQEAPMPNAPALPVPKESPVPETALSPNRGGPRARTLGVVVHTTRSGRSWTPQEEFSATARWLMNPASQVSAHVVVGPRSVAWLVPDTDEAWHCREANSTHLGIEIVQATPTTPIPNQSYVLAAGVIRGWALKYGFPLERVTDDTKPGIVGHEDTRPGQRDGKTDPASGGGFSWAKLMDHLKASPPTAIDQIAVTLALDGIWEQTEQLARLEHRDHAVAIQKQVSALKKAIGVGT